MSSPYESTQAEPGYLHPSFIEAVEPAWTPLTSWRTRFADGCADDRPVTPQSAAYIDQALASTGLKEIMSLEDGYASMFGAQIGQAKVLLMAGAAVHGPGFITKIGNFEGSRLVIARARGRLSMLHSAEIDEQSPIGCCAHGTQAVGCAYCMNLGATAYYQADHFSKPQADREAIRHIKEVAAADQQVVFGHTNYVQSLATASTHVERYFASIASKIDSDDAGETRSDARSVSFERQNFARLQGLGNHVMIVAGDHALVEETGLINSYDLRSLGSANIAAEMDQPFYRSDIGVITRNLAPVLKEFGIPPSVYAAAAQYDSTVVRALLVSAQYEGELDPVQLPLGVRGDVTGNLGHMDKLWQ